MKSLLFIVCLLLTPSVFASGGALEPIGPYGAAARETQLDELHLRAYYPTRKTVQTPSLTDSPILQTRFPVLLLLPDPEKQSQDYRDLVIQLVSHGYIVIAINNAFDGEPMDNLLKVRKALSRENNLLPELSRHAQQNYVGLLGCAQAAEITATAAQNYPQLFTAGAIIDSKEKQRIVQPTYDKTPFLQLLETTEISSDQPTLPSNNFVIRLKSAEDDQLEDFYVLQFFDMYLKGVTSYCLAHCLSVSEDSLIKCGGYKVRLRKLKNYR